MNRQIERLYAIATRERRLIVGLMSGTSMDGLDVALCRIAGSGAATRLEVLQFDTRSYPDGFRDRVLEVFAKRQVDQQVLSGLNAWIGQMHGRLVNETLAGWGIANDTVDAIASHGQTVYHAPRSFTGDDTLPDSTLQLGDGDHVAVTTGIITISDFRQKHIAAGGEGAPLAAYGDYLLFTDDRETRVLLNIGGIANLTYLPARDSGRSCFATDIGPGNTVMDQYMRAHLDMDMDRDARLAASGTVSEPLLRALLDHSFFDAPVPKTTGPELFNLRYLARAQERSGTESLGDADVMATLCAFSAEGICAAIRRIAGSERVQVYASGGGAHNPLLMQAIRNGLPGIGVSLFDRLGVSSDAKEAVLFAVLANETLAGSPANVAALHHAPAVCMGKISFPE